MNTELSDGFDIDRAQMDIMASAKDGVDKAAEAAKDAVEATDKGELGQFSKEELSRKTLPIRRTAEKLGRNDPCVCGSGKKFKACCLDKGRTEKPMHQWAVRRDKPKETAKDLRSAVPV